MKRTVFLSKAYPTIKIISLKAVSGCFITLQEQTNTAITPSLEPQCYQNEAYLSLIGFKEDINI